MGVEGLPFPSPSGLNGSVPNPTPSPHHHPLPRGQACWPNRPTIVLPFKKSVSIIKFQIYFNFPNPCFEEKRMLLFAFALSQALAWGVARPLVLVGLVHWVANADEEGLEIRKKWNNSIFIKQFFNLLTVTFAFLLLLHFLLLFLLLLLLLLLMFFPTVCQGRVVKTFSAARKDIFVKFGTFNFNQKLNSVEIICEWW